MPSPIVIVDNQTTETEVTVPAATLFTVALVDPAGVDFWELVCTTTDPDNDALEIQSNVIVDQVSKTADVLSPQAGSALIFRSTVNFGLDINDAPDPRLTVEFEVHVPTAAGALTFATNETTQANTALGWTNKLHRIALLAGTSDGYGSASVGSAGQIQASDGGGQFTAPANVRAGSGFVSVGSNPASLGSIRLTNTGSIVVRNSDNTANLKVVDTNSSNEVSFGGGTKATLSASGAVLIRSASLSIQSADGSTTRVVVASDLISSSLSLALTADPSMDGLIRTPASNDASNVVIAAINSDDDAVGLLRFGEDTIEFGDVTCEAIVNGSVTSLQVAGHAQVLVDGTTVALSKPVVIANTTAPSTPSSAVALYSESGVLKYKDPSGTVHDLSSAAAFAAGGDLSGSSTSQAVIGLTGSSGTLAIASTGAIVQWASTSAAPSLNQATVATNSATGQALKVQAQNASGTTSTGGGLTLTSGSGTSAAGVTKLQTGGTDRISISGSALTLGTVDTFESTALYFTKQTSIRSQSVSGSSSTSLFTWTIQDEAVTRITVEGCAVKSDGTVGATFLSTHSFRRHSGTVTAIGTVTNTPKTEASSAAWTQTITNSGSTGQVNVTGDSGSTRWGITVSISVEKTT